MWTRRILHPDILQPLYEYVYVGIYCVKLFDLPNTCRDFSEMLS